MSNIRIEFPNLEDGSYLIVRKPRWGVRRRLLQIAARLPEAPVGSKMKLEKLSTYMDTVTELLQAFWQQVVEWDWTDDDGNVLPLPGETEENVIDLLSDEQVTALLDAFTEVMAAGEETRKKSVSESSTTFGSVGKRRGST